MLGGPLLHLVHRRPVRAVISLAMRTGLPIGAVLLLSSLHRSACPSDSTSCDDFSGYAPFLIGFDGELAARSPSVGSLMGLAGFYSRVS